MSDDGLYLDTYAEFLKKRAQAKGYDFQQAPEGSAPPPIVTSTGKLRWWTLGRWKRLRKVREERDRRMQDIIQLGTPRPR